MVNYDRYTRYIRNIIIDAGYSKSSGESNIDAFYQNFKSVLKTSKLTLSKSTFASQVRGPDSDPYGRTINAVAVILSFAAGKKITPAILNDLIDRETLDQFTDPIDESTLPTHEESEGLRAMSLLESMASLSLVSRSLIAPKVLSMLAADWEFLDLPETSQVARLLQRELKTRGIGIDNYSANVLGGMISAKTIREIHECKMPSEKLTMEQIVRLSENLRSLNGEPVSLQELQSIAPHLTLERR